jgi:hypothetical protein
VVICNAAHVLHAVYKPWGQGTQTCVGWAAHPVVARQRPTTGAPLVLARHVYHVVCFFVRPHAGLRMFDRYYVQHLSLMVTSFVFLMGLLFKVCKRAHSAVALLANAFALVAERVLAPRRAPWHVCRSKV